MYVIKLIFILIISFIGNEELSGEKFTCTNDIEVLWVCILNKTNESNCKDSSSRQSIFFNKTYVEATTHLYWELVNNFPTMIINSCYQMSKLTAGSYNATCSSKQFKLKQLNTKQI